MAKQLINYKRSRFNKFYLKDLFTNKLEECTEDDFDATVTKFRSMYDMKYEGPNRQVFLRNGIIEAARERT